MFLPFVKTLRKRIKPCHKGELTTEVLEFEVDWLLWDFLLEFSTKKEFMCIKEEVKPEEQPPPVFSLRVDNEDNTGISKLYSRIR